MYVLQILNFVVVIEVFFFKWILDALSRMIQNLENHIRNSNYMRDLLLRLVFIIYIFLSNLWAVFSIVNQKGNVILD